MSKSMEMVKNVTFPNKSYLLHSRTF